jgi:AraC-like DNA-binding protein
MPYLVRSACLTGYVGLARSLDLDPFALLKEVGLDRDCLIDPERKIPVDAVRRLLHMSGIVAGLDDFGLRLVGARPSSFLGPLALAVRDAATLRQALETVCRFLPLHREGAVLSLEKLGDGAIFRLEAIGGGGSPARQSVESGVGTLHRVMRQLLGDAWRPRPVWFSHSAPAILTAHLNMFGPWVEFERDWNGILLAGRDLDAPLPAADPIMAQHVQQYLEPMLAKVNATLSERTRQLVYELLPSGSCFVELMAERLCMNSRTMHRYLARDGETFSSIVDSVRVDLARRYVGDGGRPLSEISDLLGFSALSSFSRWFRAKFDCSPMVWRANKYRRAEARSAAL